MIINKIESGIKCDSILCFNNATFEIVANSFKGNQYLCNKCYKEYQKLFKDSKKSDEK